MREYSSLTKHTTVSKYQNAICILPWETFSKYYNIVAYTTWHLRNTTVTFVSVPFCKIFNVNRSGLEKTFNSTVI